VRNLTRTDVVPSLERLHASQAPARTNTGVHDAPVNGASDEDQRGSWKKSEQRRPWMKSSSGRSRRASPLPTVDAW
jgi:hypothetical protein